MKYRVVVLKKAEKRNCTWRFIMLAVVKMPHTDLSIRGDYIPADLLDDLRDKYGPSNVTVSNDDMWIDFEKTDLKDPEYSLGWMKTGFLRLGDCFFYNEQLFELMKAKAVNGEKLIIMDHTTVHGTSVKEDEAGVSTDYHHNRFSFLGQTSGVSRSRRRPDPLGI